MPLSAGTRLGSYVIEAALGAGGMGEVYRARDTRLNRDVAIKVLPDLFADDPDRLVRFEREAQILASLNHPNIAHIYGIEESAGVRGLVMELVEGPTLADLCAVSRLPVPEVVTTARQIADALEAAHEQGIVHRDLKPGNIKVRPDGSVKVLDFGLAVAYGASSSSAMNSPTVLQATGVGVILGTAAYMSPEQAKGKPVDRRADIWAFGVVLFEMLTGTRLFDGETIVETLGLVATREPDLSRLPAGTPRYLRELVGRCLERDPKKRLRDIGEARIVLETPPADFPSPQPGSSVRPRLSSLQRLTWVGSLVVAGLAAGAGVWLFAGSRAVPSPQVRRFTIVAPDNARVMHAAIAPDGRVVAFVSADRIWLRRLDEVDAHEIKGTGGARGVSWSPDSQFIAFESRGQLMKVAISGGEPAVICPVPQAFSPSAGVAWLDDGRIVFTTGGSGLLEVSAQGGTARSFLEPGRPREIDFHDVTALPGGRGVLFVPHVERNQNTIELFDGRSRRVVYTSTRTVHDPVYAPSGHLLFLQDASVWAVPFSLADAKAVGEPFVVATRAAHATVSADGTLVVEPGSSLADAQLAWVDRDGRVLEAVGPRGHVLVGSRLSPDGSRLAGAIEAAGNLDLWTLDVNTGAEMRLTFEAEDDRGPAWSADGKTIVYGCGSNICARAADGSGGRHVLLQEAGGPALSPDGRALVFSRSAATTGPDLWTVPFTGTAPSVVEAAAKPLVVADGPQRSPVFSPDGRYVSYESFTAPTWSGFVTAFPSGDGRWEVAKEVGSGGASVRWTVKGDRLYWLDRAYGLVEMDVSTVPSFRVRGTRQLGLIAAGVMSATTFQPSLDGAKFLVTLTNAAPGTESRVVVIENWTASRR